MPPRAEGEPAQAAWENLPASQGEPPQEVGEDRPRTSGEPSYEENLRLASGAWYVGETDVGAL